ncbi:hypothetical protein K1T71_001568 [Dendrolimus kikuchii]|uniref:Uncharacterized protein n=1 Tax=Dendrolimus kikuchii TaxID=765133 RepID=A0ACC1DEL4_9NEOP|nr:hypothetical protein K1T71_001568 [Dendrolimus kikuchii]
MSNNFAIIMQLVVVVMAILINEATCLIKISLDSGISSKLTNLLQENVSLGKNISSQVTTLLQENVSIGNNISSSLISLLKTYAIEPDYEFTLEDFIQYNLGLSNEDVHLNATQLISKYNYPVEEHTVETSDGYLLTLIRIPNEGKPAVLLVHGILLSADDYITVGPESALPYLLHKQGYDVWLGNVRGNKYSRKHVSLSPDSAEFWNYTWNDIGLYDLPSMINYTLSTTGKSNLTYIGYSQGTTAFFVMCSEIKCENMISAMIALAPVAWFSHIKSPLLKVIADFSDELTTLSSLIGVNEFLPSDPFMTLTANVLCANAGLAAVLCSNLLFTLTGFDYDQMNVTNLPVIYGHVPSGTSVKDLNHYGQNIKANTFRKYDYGSDNINIYGTNEPPAYNITNIDVPVVLYYGDNDWLSVYDDIVNLINGLPNIIKVYRVPYDKFNHGDFMWAKDVKTLLYDDVLTVMQKYANFG